MRGLARLFFFVDAIFVILFSVCSLIYANHDAVLITLVVVGLVTVYPLYIFVDAYTRDDADLRASWYLEYFNMLMLYCMVRAFMLFGFFSWVLIDMAKISVTTVISHFPVFVIVTLFIMMAALLTLVVIALRLVPRQRAVVYEFVKKYETEEDEACARVLAAPKPSEGLYFTS